MAPPAARTHLVAEGRGLNTRHDVLFNVLDDLEQEGRSLESVLTPLSTAEWDRVTPAPAWRIREQVSHLGFVDRRARVALTDAVAFGRLADDDRADVERFEETQVVPGRTMDATALLSWWTEGRDELAAALRNAPDDTRVPWYGPSMSVSSFATARLMETWAHGCDIRDALAMPLTGSRGLAHVARLGFQTRAWSYIVRELPPPSSPIAVELTFEDERWMFGEPSAADRITGSALGFCLVVTQRRHVSDVDLELSGIHAEKWMQIAQAFAGAPGPGRAPQGAGR